MFCLGVFVLGVFGKGGFCLRVYVRGLFVWGVFVLEPVHTGTEKDQAVRSKTGPEIGRYRKMNQKLERHDIVPFRSRVNRSGTISYRFPDLFGIYG